MMGTLSILVQWPWSWLSGARQPAGSFASSPQAHRDEGGERDSLEEQQWEVGSGVHLAGQGCR